MFSTKARFIAATCLGAILAIAFALGRARDQEQVIARTLLTQDKTSLASILGTNWQMVCAFTQVSGGYYASLRPQDEKELVMTALSEAGVWAREEDWYLAVLIKKNSPVVTYRFNRRAVPFTDGPFVSKLYASASIRGRPALCTRAKQAHIKKLSQDNQFTLTLME